MIQAKYCDTCSNDHSSEHIDIYTGSWSSWIKTGGGYGGSDALSFYTSYGEVRPINTAVRIWKRIK